MTITSSRSLVSGSRMILKTFEVGLISCPFIPMNVTSRMLEELTFERLNVPSFLEVVPFKVPLTRIDAPATGCPSSDEMTVPLIVFS